MQNFYISSGAGTSQYRLVAFDNALHQTGISDYNLLRVSSILPMGSVQQHTVDLEKGSLLPTAYASISSNTQGEKIATAIAVGISKQSDNIGVIMEYEMKGTKDEARNVAEAMVKEAMANRGIDIDEIVSSAIDGVVEHGYLTLVSAIAMW